MTDTLHSFILVTNRRCRIAIHQISAIALLLALLALSACADAPAKTPFAALASRVEVVLHTPAAEREAYFALHYDDLLIAEQVVFPEDYLSLSGAEKAMLWRFI